MSQGELILHTVTSNWYSGFSEDQTYQRVVAIESGDTRLEATKSPERSKDPQQGWDTDAVGQIAFSVNDIFSDRLFEFFERYLTDVRAPWDKFNCHSFAYWMAGTTGVREQLLLQPELPKGTRRVKPPFQQGTHAVLGETEMKLYHSPADHSVVGFGTDTSYCLQVQGAYGHLGLDTYSGALAAWRAPHTKPAYFFAPTVSKSLGFPTF